MDGKLQHNSNYANESGKYSEGSDTESTRLDPHLINLKYLVTLSNEYVRKYVPDGRLMPMAVFEKVLVAVDLAENSLPPLRKALELEQSGSDLTCLHVVPEDGEEARSFRSFFDAEGAEASVLENYALPWLENWIKKVDVSLPESVELSARLGDPTDEILEEASSGEYDLIVIGTHGRQGMKRYWMGSVAESVIRRSPCPVMTVRASVTDPDVIEE